MIEQIWTWTIRQDQISACWLGDCYTNVNNNVNNDDYNHYHHNLHAKEQKANNWNKQTKTICYLITDWELIKRNSKVSKWEKHLVINRKFSHRELKMDNYGEWFSYESKNENRNTAILVVVLVALIFYFTTKCIL